MGPTGTGTTFKVRGKRPALLGSHDSSRIRVRSVTPVSVRQEVVQGSQINFAWAYGNN